MKHGTGWTGGWPSLSFFFFYDTPRPDNITLIGQHGVTNTGFAGAPSMTLCPSIRSLTPPNCTPRAPSKRAKALSRHKTVTQFGPAESEQMPAPRAGGLYKSNCHQQRTVL